MFNEFEGYAMGLNFDPSHFVWQEMDYLAAIREFAPRFWHCHAKDAQLDREKLSQTGIMAHPLEFHTPKLPGLGDVEWGPIFRPRWPTRAIPARSRWKSRTGPTKARSPLARRRSCRASVILRQFVEPY